jgi:predicted MFS family arabinose efflux permease
MLLALALGFLALRPGGLTLPILMGFAIASGIGAALSLPMSQGVLGDLVPPEHIPMALGLWSVQFNLSRIVGPALAAFLFPLIGAAGNFLLNGLSFLVFILVVWRLKVASVPVPAGLPATYREGLAVFLGNPVLGRVFILSVIAGLFAWPYFALLPVYGTRYLAVGERGVAFLLSAFGAGAVVGGLWASRRGNEKGTRPILAPFVVFGLGLISLGVIPRFAWACVSLSVMGIAQAHFLNAIGSQVQWHAPPHLRGRANAIYLTAILGLLPLGNLASGELAQALGFQGPRWVIALNGAAMALGASLMALNRKGIETNSP